MIASAARPQPLVDLVGQRLDRRHDDRVAGVDAQRVDVLHRAHRDARVLGVAHDLVLDLLPADEAALDHHLLDRARPEARADPLPVRVLGLDDAAARAAERERRPDDRRQADVGERRLRRGVARVLVRALDDERRRVRLVDPVEQVAERLAVLGHADRLERRPEQADVVALEDAGLRERRRQVERRLAAEPGQQALGLLAGDDGLDRVDGERLEVDGVGDRRVGHDRGRVGVDEDRAHALGAQGAAGLGAGVVELRRLADDDGAAAEDQHRRRLRRGGSPRRGRSSAVVTCRAAGVTNRSNTASASSGPGAPSGWYWTVSIGFSRVAQPLHRAVVEVELAHPEARRRRDRRRRRPGPRGSARSPGRSPCRGPGPGGSRRGARTAAGWSPRRPPVRRSGGRGRSPAAAGRRR